MNNLFFPVIYVILVFVSTCSQILLKKSNDNPGGSFLSEYLNKETITAYGIFFLVTLATVLIIKYIPLIFVPVLECFGYIFIAVLGKFFLKTPITKNITIGIILIISGIIVFSL